MPSCKIPYKNAVPLTASEQWRIDKFSHLPVLEKMLHSFGYTIGDLRKDPASNDIVFPGELSQFIDAFKANKADSAVAVGLNYSMIGMDATFADLSDSSLNGKIFMIIQVFPDENKLLIDATPDGYPPGQVRYVKVPFRKLITGSKSSKTDSMCCAAVMESKNRDAAFAAADLDLSAVVCLKSRPCPEVEHLRVFRDVPLLCAELNEKRVPGHPFSVVFGFNIFSNTDWDKFKKRSASDDAIPSALSAEPLVVLKDRRGNLIDTSTDIGTINREGVLGEQLSRKIFVPDSKIGLEAWGAMYNYVDNMIEYCWMPTTPWRENIDEWLSASRSETDGTHLSQDVVDLGMLPSGLNSRWIEGHSILCHPFLDSGVSDTDKKAIKEIHEPVILQRRNAVEHYGAVLLSRNLAIQFGYHGLSTNGSLIFREFGGTICFACFTRLTVDESKVCNGCGKARYCSAACQVWHWKSHKVCCASKEERVARHLAAEKYKAERAEQLCRHEQFELRKKAEEEAKVAERKALASRERVRRAVEQAEQAAERERRTVPRPPLPRSNGKARATQRSMEAELVHRAWTSPDEKHARTAAFIEHQELQHLEAVARKARAKADSLKKSESDVLKQEAAAAHEVPSPPSISSVLNSVLR